MVPEDVGVMNDLSKLYKENERYDDQIFILEQILKVDQGNEIAQSELAMAFENSGRDPLDVYRKRYEDNPENLSYGLDYADRLMQAESYQDALPILRKLISKDPNSKLSYRKFAEASKLVDDLDGAAKAYEELFKIDPRDIKTAINISDIYLENDDYRQALKWADKASTLIAKMVKAKGRKEKCIIWVGQFSSKSIY